MPADFPVVKAAQFALNPITAWVLLEKLELKSGDWLALTVGNSTLAQLIAQIAALRGIRVIAIQYHNSPLIYKNISISGFGIRGYLESKTAVQKAEITRSLVEIMADPDFKLEAAAAYQLVQYKEAINAAQQNTGNGKANRRLMPLKMSRTPLKTD